MVSHLIMIAQLRMGAGQVVQPGAVDGEVRHVSAKSWQENRAVNMLDLLSKNQMDHSVLM